ncbi:transcription cofactor vestigial-like protein 4 isoform X8 [Erythrolamprus reginae]|uniref:transcription cofactor vestigial-like protein 4 isoform X8 n=1 Tax=Erythrolamprus reginae TaxID=121349 RepID=UPI00396C40B3
MLFMKMDMLNYQYLDKMNNNIGILRQYEGEAALRGEPRMQSLPISAAAATNHRTGPPPISPCKRRFSMDQGEDDLDCEREHLPKMGRLFNPHLSQLPHRRETSTGRKVSTLTSGGAHSDRLQRSGAREISNEYSRERFRIKTANGDYRKEHRDRSRSPIERAVAPTMALHGNHIYASIPSLTMEQPLALTKNSMDVIRSVSMTPTMTSVERQQNRPSVITCASASNRNCNLSHCPVVHSGCGAAMPTSYRRPSSTTATCDPVVEEHFRRSLGKNYKEPEAVTNSVSITGSVDDHFAKALGDTWLQIKAAKDGVSNSPESASRRGQSSSPPSSHLVNHNHSPSVVS